MEKDTYIEKTEYLKIHNFPPSPGTYSYLTRVYRKYERDNGWKEIDGAAIYLHTLPKEQLALAIIMGNAQNTLSNTLDEKE